MSFTAYTNGIVEGIRNDSFVVIIHYPGLIVMLHHMLNWISRNDKTQNETSGFVFLL